MWQDSVSKWQNAGYLSKPRAKSFANKLWLFGCGSTEAGHGRSKGRSVPGTFQTTLGGYHRADKYAKPCLLMPLPPYLLWTQWDETHWWSGKLVHAYVAARLNLLYAGPATARRAPYSKVPWQWTSSIPVLKLARTMHTRCNVGTYVLSSDFKCTSRQCCRLICSRLPHPTMRLRISQWQFSKQISALIPDENREDWPSPIFV